MPSTALDYITIHGFKSIACIDKLPLNQVNIMIGPNGSGKSNFIGAFSFLNAIREGRLRDYVIAAGGAEKVLHFGSKTTKEIHFDLYFDGGNIDYRLTLRPTSDDGLFQAGEVAGVAQGQDHAMSDRPPEPGQQTGSHSPTLEERIGWVRHRAAGSKPYHLHDTSSSSLMRKTAKLHDNEFLRPDGSNITPFLYLIQERHPESFRLIRHTIQQVAPFFEDFQLRPLNLKPDDIKMEWRHRKSDQYFDASSLSDGTLRFIALATIFLQPVDYRPSLILLDEPELGLHPYAIEMLASLIRQASVQTQVIVSTQSSLLLDHFEPEDVLVADRVNGGTELTRLSADKLALWLEEYSLGQLWEKNELGGRPTPE